MGLRDLNIDLTKKHVALWKSSKEFLGEVWRPAAIELDKLSDPEDVIAEGRAPLLVSDYVLHMRL